jgi:hypothetical protein
VRERGARVLFMFALIKEYLDELFSPTYC